jgi:hypothetical protein
MDALMPRFRLEGRIVSVARRVGADDWSEPGERWRRLGLPGVDLGPVDQLGEVVRLRLRPDRPTGQRHVRVETAGQRLRGRDVIAVACDHRLATAVSAERPPACRRATT